MKRSSFIVATLVLFCFHSKFLMAQCDADPNIIPLPKMFIPKVFSSQDIKEFSKYHFLRGSKLGQLKKNNIVRSGNNALIITYEAIKTVLNSIKDDSVRIHFARFNSLDYPGVTNLSSNTIILLFASEKEVNPKQYYFINNEENAPYVISASIGQKWIDDFNNTNQRFLKRTIRKRHRDNYPDSDMKKNSISDTKSMLYDRLNMIEAFLNEKDYQLKHNNRNLDAFKVVFSAYSPKGKQYKSDDKRLYRRRLFVQFDYLERTTDGLFVPLTLEELDDYNCRLCKTKPSECKGNFTTQSLDSIEKTKSIDNGQLCPTNCPK